MGAVYSHLSEEERQIIQIEIRLETLRGIAMGFDNFEHYRQRSLIHSGRIKDILTH